jgi:hypothetical protein
MHQGRQPERSGMSAESEHLKPGGPVTPEKLRWIADYFDLADKAVKLLSQQLGEPFSPGDGVQRDLRRWADELEATEDAPE